MSLPQAANADEALSVLGLPLSEFRVGVPRILLSFLTGLGLVFGGAIGLLMAYGALVLHHNPLGVIFLVTGLLFVGWGLMTPWCVMRNRHLRIFLGPNGVGRQRGDEVAVCLWDDITDVALQGRACLQHERDNLGQEEVWVRLTSGRDDTSRSTGYRAVILTRTDGSSVKLEDYVRDFDRLTQGIQQATLDRLWPPYQEAFRAGRAVRFGVFSVNKTGLEAAVRGQTALDSFPKDAGTFPVWTILKWVWQSIRPHRDEEAVVPLPKPGEVAAVEVPWEEIAGVQVVRDLLVFHFKGEGGRWIGASLLTVPNPHVLVKLARVFHCIPVS